MKYDKQGYLSKFLSEMFDFLRYYMSLQPLLPWQHTGFQTSTILKAFLTTLSILY